MDPISKLARSLGIARRRVEDRGGKTANAPEHADAAPARPRAEDSRVDLARRVRSVDTQAPGGRDACVRLVLEYMLAREFGTTAVESAAMQQTIRDVQRVMDADPAVRQDFDALIDGIRREK